MSSPEVGASGRLASLLAGDERPPTLTHLIEAGCADLPRPGAGRTLERWRVLAAVAARDLTLVKLFEGHTDALAILAELDGPAPAPASRWGTWCAEPPDARLELRTTSNGDGMRLDGTKAWCSGAASSTHAIVSCWNDRGEPCLAAVMLDQPGVTVTDVGWQAVGMAGTGSVDVRFDAAEATQVGQPGDYVRRPGFWQGGAGIAACWYGEAAAWIDTHPQANAQRLAARARLAVEQAATRVVDHAGRALGAGPLCRDARFARAMADLPVFLRQSHAERDLASLGVGLINDEDSPWTL
ncbi:MAG: acyl-CoA dehydrogenase [Variovorax sp.]|nr:MAG: acyl-CoA dehydrogenase [Variovorax sp.]